jgi:dTDP-4-amino-4,6-dideoxygalactose transaminase
MDDLSVNSAFRSSTAARRNGSRITVESPSAAPAELANGGDSVPMAQLDNADPALFDALMLAVERIAFRAAFTLGEEVEAFERDFASYCETEYAIGVSSGTEALALSLRALDIGPGDEVIVPTNSFIATAEAVALVGATPRLVDVDPESHTISAEILKRSIGPRTRGVIPVHLYGRTADLEPVLRVAREAGLAVVEDACQAHGARYRDKPAGSLGDCGCFSFYPSKNLGGWGDGGAVVTRDSEIAERVRLLRSHGEGPKYRHRVCGTTGRLDAIQAAVLRVKLPMLDDWNAERRRLGALLTELLTGSSVATPPRPPAGHDHVFHQYVVRTHDRDGLQAHLAERGIASAVHYPVPIHLSEAFGQGEMRVGELTHAEQLSREICSLPLYPGMTDGAMERVAAAVHDFRPSPFRRSRPASTIRGAG